MTYIAGRWKMAVVLVLLLLLAGLTYVGSSLAQIAKEEVDFEILDTVVVTKDADTRLWNLAQKYYGNPLKWTLIKDMNRIPNEKTIPEGTVIYIPVEEAKRIVKKVEEEIQEKKVVEVDLSKELEMLRKELRACQEKNKELEAKNKRLSKMLEDRDATIKKKEATIRDLEGMLDNVKAAMDKMKADTEAELEAQAQEMRAAARNVKERESRAESQVEELEAKLRQQRRDIEQLEMARDELRARIRQAELTPKKPPMPVKKPSDPRSRVAAVAIALVGAIIWVASN
jgi:DNA repair exonuclease SbcCD ATPase subunit